MRIPAILIAAGDEQLRRRLKGLFRQQKYGVIELPDNTGVLQAFQRTSPDLVIVGSSRDDLWGGIRAAQQIRRWDRSVPLILLATNSFEELAIAALKAGISDYFRQPISGGDLSASIMRYLSDIPARKSPPQSAPIPSGLINGQRMIGDSPPMREIKRYIAKVASTDSNVLITGETGTGKELVAELIQQNSARCQKPFVCINCAAIPDTLLESELFGYERGAFTGATSRRDGQLKLADGGSIFFDEIGDMSPYAQAKILRAIESKEVQRLGGRGSTPLDVRIIAATNQDLERMSSEGKFRKDLYFRLNVARIQLPPLRNRKGDIPSLCGRYIQEFNRRFGIAVEGFTDEAVASMLRYDWPGNVRELRNLLEGTFINLPGQHISFIDLPEQFRQHFRETKALPQDERERLLSALSATHWNVSKTAQQLHWSRLTLYRKMTKYRISKGGETKASATALSAGKV